MKRVCWIVTAATLAVGVGAGYATSGWTEYEKSPTDKDLNAVTFINANNGWAVGYWGVILRYLNGRWTVREHWPIQYFQDVDFGNANFGMAIGQGGGGAVYNGTKWLSANLPKPRNMWGVTVPPGQNKVAWAVGARGSVYRWSGGPTGAWSRFDIGITAGLHDVFFSSQTDGWLCGNLGKIYHFADSKWTAVNAPTGVNFFCIYALSPNNVWVGGANGKLFHYEGVKWTPVYTPASSAIREMAFTSPTSGWGACDDGVMLRYNGVEWSLAEIKPPTSRSFSGLFMLSDREGWAVGKNGMIYRYRNFYGVEATSLGKVKALFE
ncbi:MAG: hypothetical protein GTN49_03735 [candidate division Zixibacteria bacterium]|nr:hypothetical protein [candidate division Zixibacteria bacterium]